MELLYWAALGAAIGGYAAQKKGFAIAGGVVAGLLLGPLAILLFFVRGIFSMKEQQQKCPHCAEWIRPEAKVCKHCHKDLPSMPSQTVTHSAASIVRTVALVFGSVAFTIFALGWLIVRGPALPRFTTPPTVTMSEFSGLRAGMTYQQAIQIIGARGEEISRSDIADFKTVMYLWKNGDGSNMNAMFQNGALVNKAQFGLR
jgi:hypothetical protein